jgi:hypothetical protein
MMEETWIKIVIGIARVTMIEKGIDIVDVMRTVTLGASGMGGPFVTEINRGAAPIHLTIATSPEADEAFQVSMINLKGETLNCRLQVLRRSFWVRCGKWSSIDVNRRMALFLFR